MASPLELLRTYNIQERKIIENDGYVVFGDVSFPKTVNTNYMEFGYGKNGIPKKYYTLECLLFFLKNKTLSHPEYVQLAYKENVPIVRKPDRKKVLDYLDGVPSRYDSIDHYALVENVTQVTADDAQNSIPPAE